MPGRDLIVIGASAGGIEALLSLAADLPRDLPAALLVVVHLSPTHRSVLPRMLSAAGPLPASHAVDGETVMPGRIYLAPPNRHLLLNEGKVRLSTGPLENGHRPAVDTLFRTAARDGGERVIGVVLSGALDDGTAGLIAIRERGGLCVVQDPDDAVMPDMPRHALEHVQVDHCVRVDEMAKLFERLVVEPLPGRVLRESPTLEREAHIALRRAQEVILPPGDPSTFGCPNCGGVLWEVQEGSLLRFRCRVGHAFSTEALQAEQQSALESALWASLRALEEQASLTRRMGTRARDQGQQKSAERYDQRAQSAEVQAKLVREALNRGLDTEPSDG
jgi:two-component system chemotaxis response regulator CheB